MRAKQTVIARCTPLCPFKRSTCVLSHVIASTQRLFLHHLLHYFLMSLFRFHLIRPFKTLSFPPEDCCITSSLVCTGSALVVFVYHCVYLLLSGGWLWWWRKRLCVEVCQDGRMNAWMEKGYGERMRNERQKQRRSNWSASSTSASTSSSSSLWCKYSMRFFLFLFLQSIESLGVFVA